MLSGNKLQHRSRLGQLLVKRKVISSVQLADALDYQRKRQIRLGTALLELGLVEKSQLDKALRRQVWLRRLAALIALLSTPFTPAIAAGGGNLNSASSASASISLIILPKTIASKDSAITFETGNTKAKSAPLCITPQQTPLYRLRAEDDSNGENFSLHSQEKSNSQNIASYQLLFRQSQSGFRLSNGKYSVVLSANKDCEQNKNRLDVMMSSAVANDSPMIGKLQITIAAE